MHTPLGGCAGQGEYYVFGVFHRIIRVAPSEVHCEKTADSRDFCA